MPAVDLQQLRAMIDQADKEMLQAISRHLALALQVERNKRDSALSDIVCPDRVAEKRQQLINLGLSLDPPLDPDFVVALWELLHGHYALQELLQRQRAAQTSSS